MMNAPSLMLTTTVKDDLELFYQFQLDQDANYLAAFTAKDPHDRGAYFEKYTKFLTDPNIHMRTIHVNDRIVGSIARFYIEGDAEITYWIDRPYWGQGIASSALTRFLKMELTRPLYGRTAFDNIGSQRVLEKCGFVRTGQDKGFANARQAEIEEYIYRLSE